MRASRKTGVTLNGGVAGRRAAPVVHPIIRALVPMIAERKTPRDGEAPGIWRLGRRRKTSDILPFAYDLGLRVTQFENTMKYGWRGLPPVKARRETLDAVVRSSPSFVSTVDRRAA